MATSLIIGKLADYKAKYFPHLASTNPNDGPLEGEYLPTEFPVETDTPSCEEIQPADVDKDKVEQDA